MPPETLMQSTKRTLKKYFITYGGNVVVSATSSWAKSTGIKSIWEDQEQASILDTRPPSFSEYSDYECEILRDCEPNIPTHKIPQLTLDLSISLFYIFFLLCMLWLQGQDNCGTCSLLFLMKILFL